MNRPILVLLHTASVPTVLKNFFAANGVKCITKEEWTTASEPTHLVMDPSANLKQLIDDYQTVEHDVRLVSTGPVPDLGAFLAANGRLVADPEWLNRPMGKVILEKFFLGRAGVNLDENFPAIKEHGGFKVTNHLRMGHDLDRLASFIHARDTGLVSARTFVDHAIYYCCYLAQAGIASAPFDVDYGFTGKEIVVQVHLTVRRFLAENILECFNSPKTDEPAKHLLRVCAQSSDFAEIQYIEAASKLVISGLWQGRVDAKPPAFTGLLVSHIRTTEQIARAALTESASQLVDPAAVVEATEAEVLGEKPLAGAVPNPPWEEAPDIVLPTVEVAPVVVEEEKVEVIKGSAPEPEAVQNVKGSKEAPEASQNIKGSKDAPEQSQTVKGTKEEKENFSTRIGGDKPAEKPGLQTISSGSSVKPDDIVTSINGASAPQNKGAWGVKSLGGGDGAANGAGVGKSVAQAQGGLTGAAPGMKLTDLNTGNPASGSAGGINMQDAAAKAKISQLESELRKTKSMLDIANKDLRVLKEARNQMLEIDSKFKASQVAAPEEDALEAIDAVKRAENEARKAKLEIQQKQVFFSQELEKVQRQLKSRDLVIEKAKDSLKMLTEKKDQEINELKGRLESMSANPTASATAFQQLKTLEQEKQSLTRLVEVYKTKLTTMTAKIEQKASGAVKEEDLRKVQLEKQTAQVALSTAQKDIAKLKAKAEVDQSELQRLASERNALEAKFKAASNLNANMPVHVQNSAADEVKNLRIQELERELAARDQKVSKLEANAKELEKKVQELAATMAKNGQSGDGNLKSKAAHLEGTVKKLTQDLAAANNLVAEAKKEVVKVRAEKTALQNQIDKLQKDAAKNNPKGAPPKKAA